MNHIKAVVIGALSAALFFSVGCKGPGAAGNQGTGGTDTTPGGGTGGSGSGTDTGCDVGGSGTGTDTDDTDTDTDGCDSMMDPDTGSDGSMGH